MPDLTLESLAQRVAALEAKIMQLELTSPTTKDWRRTIGMFAGDEVMRDIMDAALEIREAERREIRE